MSVAEVQAIPMTEAEARAAVESIRGQLGSIRRAVYDLHRRQGFVALGYKSWRECVVAEFGKGQTTVYQELRAARAESQICAAAQIGSIPEWQLRPLSKLRKHPEQVRVAWELAGERTGGERTMDAVAAAVDEVLAGYEGREPDPSPGPVPEPDPFQLASDPAVGSDGSARFNATNAMVDWARWTWNPVTGCEHNCVYCYARDIANRFYPEKFKPTFRPERLGAPRNTTLPVSAGKAVDPVARVAWRNVFVCSMADLFGRWVPDDWIEAVLGSCRRSPEWNYLFLTKFPNRYDGLDFPKTAWVGTSVDEQKRVANAEKSFRQVRAPVRWLSVEPMRERLKFTALDLFDWVVIGGQSKSSGAPAFFPPFDWVCDLWHEAKAAGCAVYFKPNTWPGAAGWLPKEYPKQMMEGP